MWSGLRVGDDAEAARERRVADEVGEYGLIALVLQKDSRTDGTSVQNAKDSVPVPTGQEMRKVKQALNPIL